MSGMWGARVRQVGGTSRLALCVGMHALCAQASVAPLEDWQLKCVRPRVVRGEHRHEREQPTVCVNAQMETKGHTHAICYPVGGLPPVPGVVSVVSPVTTL